MPVSEIFFWAVPVAAIIIYALLLIILTFAKKDSPVKILMVLLCTLLFWAMSSLFMKLSLFPGPLFWNKCMIAFTFGVPFFLYLFIATYLNDKKYIFKISWLLITAAIELMAGLGLVVLNANVVTSAVATPNGTIYNMTRFNYELGPGAAFAYISMLVFVIWILAYTKRETKTANSPEIAKSLKLAAVGILILFAGQLCNIIPELGSYPFDILASIINSLILTSIIFRGRILELRFILTKGLVFTFFISAVTLLYIYSAFGLENYLRRNIDILRTPYVTTALALAVAIAFQPLYRVTQLIVDRIFYGNEYIRRQSLKNFSKTIYNKLDLEQIADELLQAAQQVMHAKRVFLMLLDDEKNKYYIYKTSAKLEKPDLVIEKNQPLIKYFNQHSDCLTRHKLNTLAVFRSIWDDEMNKLKILDIEVLAPISCRNELIGMLLLTQRENNLAYDNSDFDLLSTLAASTAVAIENARSYKIAQKEALTDSLTKLYNHRFFCKEIERMTSANKNSSLALLILDLDMFKLYNDLYGHIEGDKALIKLAHIMSGIVDKKGIISRYGGEEFTVLLPNMDEHQALDMANKIRTAVERAFFSDSDTTQRFLTVSIGICTYPSGAPNSDELMKRADLALYKAKQNGKNQAVVYKQENKDTSDMIINFHSDSYDYDNPEFTTTIYALAAAIDAKDHFTFGHSQNVAYYTTALASALGLDKNHINVIRQAALLHDVGKIGIPEYILTKPGPLTPDEYAIIKRHVEMSITIIKHLPALNHVIPTVISHHERWDGKGYPRGISGEAIPIPARCLAIADAFDAMTSVRPYKKSLSVEHALNEIEDKMGTQFNPEIAKVFIRLIRSGALPVKSLGDPFPVEEESSIILPLQGVKA